MTTEYITGSHSAENMVKKFMKHPKRAQFIAAIAKVTDRDAEAVATIVYNRRANSYKELYTDESLSWSYDTKWHDIPVSSQAIATIRQSTIDRYRELINKEEN